MTISKSKQFLNIVTLRIIFNELKPKIKQGILDKGLYYLENIFGECDGHGFGFGGEDINFTIKKGKQTYKVAFNWNLNKSKYKLEVTESLELHDQNNKFYQIVFAPIISDQVVKIIVNKLCSQKPDLIGENSHV